MAYTINRVTLKSMEQRGASQPNIIELGFLSPADASAFGANVALCIGGQLASVDYLISSNYTLPYPAGTDSMTRTAITDGIGHWQQMRIYDTPSTFAPTVRAAALIASGFKMIDGDYTPTSVNIQVFTPGASV